MIDFKLSKRSHEVDEASFGVTPLKSTSFVFCGCVDCSICLVHGQKEESNFPTRS